MIDSLDEDLTLAARYLDPALVSLEELDHIAAIARRTRVSALGFECRLGERGPRADFGVRFLREDKRARAGYAEALAPPRGGSSRARSGGASWSSASAGTIRATRSTGASRTFSSSSTSPARRRRSPSLRSFSSSTRGVACPHRRGDPRGARDPRRRRAELGAARGLLPRARGAPARGQGHRGGVDALARDACGARVHHGAAGSRGVRVCRRRGVARRSRRPRRAHRPRGKRRRSGGALLRSRRRVWREDRRRAQIDGPRREKRARWAPVLDGLVAAGRCLPEKRGALERWMGYARTQEEAVCLISREINHVKLVHQRGRPLEAKAYLAFLRTWHERAPRVGAELEPSPPR